MSLVGGTWIASIRYLLSSGSEAREGLGVFPGLGTAFVLGLPCAQQSGGAGGFTTRSKGGIIMTSSFATGGLSGNNSSQRNEIRAFTEPIADSGPAEPASAGAEPPGRKMRGRRTVCGEVVALESNAGLDGCSAQEKASAKADKTETPSMVDILLKMSNDATYFRTPDGETFASIRVNSHAEICAVRSSNFRAWLTNRYYTETGRSPSNYAMTEVLDTLDAKAYHAGETHSVHLRIAPGGRSDPHAFYADLCDPEWRAIRITPDGWEVLPNPPVKFRRTKGMSALPTPVRGGSVEDLRRYVNVGSEDDWRLLVAVLCWYILPAGPFPILIFQGEQGTAKSTTTKICRQTIDPNVCPNRTKTKDRRDLAVMAENNWVVPIDNLSGLSGDISDALCCLATGGGFSVRQLYRDKEEVVFNAVRPIILNGIGDVADRPDLTDRAVILTLPVLSRRDPTTGKRRRKNEKILMAQFEAAHPRILGALLDAVAGALRELSEVNLDDCPDDADFRMADFATFGEALGRHLGWGEWYFTGIYAANRRDTVAVAVSSSPLAHAVDQLLGRSGGSWSGTATALLQDLNGVTELSITKSPGWPRDPSKLSEGLARITPALRDIGIDIKSRRTARERILELTKVDLSTITKSSASRASSDSGPNRNDFHSHSFSDEGEASKTVTRPMTRLDSEGEPADHFSSAYSPMTTPFGSAVTSCVTPQPPIWEGLGFDDGDDAQTVDSPEETTGREWHEFGANDVEGGEDQ